MGGEKENGGLEDPSGKSDEAFIEIIQKIESKILDLKNIFNEGWGQFNSDEMYDKVKALDSTRLVDSASGWFAGEQNDFDSEHIYSKNSHELTETIADMYRKMHVPAIAGGACGCIYTQLSDVEDEINK